LTSSTGEVGVPRGSGSATLELTVADGIEIFETDGCFGVRPQVGRAGTTFRKPRKEGRAPPSTSTTGEDRDTSPGAAE
jgi:hypothetical protein